MAEPGRSAKHPKRSVPPPRPRKPSVDVAEVRRLRDEEKLGPAAIARRLGIGRTSVYRALGVAMVAGRV